MLKKEAVRSEKVVSESIRSKNLFDIDEETFEAIRVSVRSVVASYYS